MPQKNEKNTTNPGDSGKPKKKVTASSISDIIKSPNSEARSNASNSPLDDGTWVDYEEHE